MIITHVRKTIFDDFSFPFTLRTVLPSNADQETFYDVSWWHLAVIFLPMSISAMSLT